MNVLNRRFLRAGAIGVGLAVALLVAVMIDTTAAARAQDAKLAASPQSGPAPLAVTFSFPHAAANSSWMMNIDFGDGASAAMTQPSSPPCVASPTGALRCPNSAHWSARHVYASAGTYTAKLTRGGLPLCFTCNPPVLGTVTIIVTAGR
jgi:PKD repeat protein